MVSKRAPPAAGAQSAFMSHPHTPRPRMEQLRERALSALERGSLSLGHLPMEGARDLQALLEELRIYQAELELQNQELVESQTRTAELLQRYSALFQHSPLPALLLDDQGNIREANDRARDLFGLRQTPLIRHSVFRLLPDRDDPTLSALLRQTGREPAARHKTARVRLRTLQVADQPFDAHLFCLSARDDAGLSGDASWILQLVDRSDQEQLERERQALQASEARWRQLFEDTEQAILVIEDGRITQANPAAARLLRVAAPHQLHGHSPVEFAPPWQAGGQSSADVFERALQSALDGGATHIDFDVQTRGGLRLTAEVSMTRMAFEGRAAVQTLWTDVTVRRRAEAAQLQRREALQRELAQREEALSDLGHRLQLSHTERASILETATSGMAVLIGTDLADTNQRFNELLGYDDHALSGQPVQGCFQHPEQYQQFLDACAQAQARGDTRRSVVECRRQDGTSLWARLTTHAVDPARPQQGLVIVLDDLSLEREALASLERARLLSEEASRMKSALMANVSHELRTPLNAIIGFDDLLRATELTPRQQGFVQQIHDASRQLLSLVNDLLDFSQMGLGPVALDRRRVGTADLMRAACEPAAERARAKGLDFELQLSDPLPQQVVGDPKRLRQLVRILLDNAVKFTASGRIRVALEQVEQDADTVVLRCSVDDTGIGIQPEQQARLFHPFQQADPSAARRFGGAGLGLSIAKALAEDMGGAIGCTSVPGQGSAFWFTVRLGLSDQAAGDAVEPASPDPKAPAAGGSRAPSAAPAARSPPGRLAELISALERSDASALELVASAMPELKAWLQSDYTDFREAVERFDFEHAWQRLSRHGIAPGTGLARPPLGPTAESETT